MVAIRTVYLYQLNGRTPVRSLMVAIRTVYLYQLNGRAPVRSLITQHSSFPGIDFWNSVAAVKPKLSNIKGAECFEAAGKSNMSCGGAL